LFAGFPYVLRNNSKYSEILAVKYSYDAISIYLIAYLVRFHGNNGTEGKYKWMHIFHVQIEGSYSIRYGIVGQNLKWRK